MTDNKQAPAIAEQTPVATSVETQAPSMTAIQFDAHLQKIVASGKELVADIQVAGMYAMNQALAHGNYDAFYRVYVAIRDGVNQRSANQFRLWATRFAPVKFITENEQVTKARLSKSETAVAFNIIGASETRWNTVEGFTGDETNAIVSKLFTADKLVDRFESLINTMKKAIEKGEYASETDKLALPAMLEKVESFKTALESDLNNLKPETQKVAA